MFYIMFRQYCTSYITFKKESCQTAFQVCQLVAFIMAVNFKLSEGGIDVYQLSLNFIC